MVNKIVKYSKSEIAKLPNNKPVEYTIRTKNNKLNYIGSTKKGEVRNRISSHLNKIPGATVSIKQHSSIKEARSGEAKAIKSKQPKYNKLGK